MVPQQKAIKSSLVSIFRMVGPEFGRNSIKAWIHPDLYKWIRLVMVPREVFTCHTLIAVVPNTTGFLDTVSDHVKSFMATVYLSFDKTESLKHLGYGGEPQHGCANKSASTAQWYWSIWTKIFPAPY